MLYTIAFITNQQLRDIKLEGILNPDFVMENYVHEGSFDYSVKINQRDFDVWSNKIYNDKSILVVTKWKTAKGASSGLKKVMDAIKTGDKKKFDVKDRGNSEWTKNEYIPVICNITNEWNEKIQSQIDKEIKSHQFRLNNLTKKLIKK